MENQVNQRLSILEAAVRALDAKVERLEKISDNNAEVHRDVSVAMGAEVSVLHRVLEDMIRGDTLLLQLGKIDFDAYFSQYREQVKREVEQAKVEAQEAEETVPEEAFEFGGDYVKDAGTG